MILGVPFGTFIAGIFNWRSAFAAAALIAVLPLVLQILFLPSVPAGDKLPPASLLDFIRHIEGRKSVLLILLIFGTHFGTYVSSPAARRCRNWTGNSHLESTGFRDHWIYC